MSCQAIYSRVASKLLIMVEVNIIVILVAATKAFAL